MPLWEHGAWGLRYAPNAAITTRMSPRTPNHWGWGFEVFRYLPYVARYSRGQVASAWGVGVEGMSPLEVSLKITTHTTAGVAELLTKDGVYRHHFERAAFRIREDGIRNPGAGATERRVEAEVDASDGAWVGGRIPYPNCLAR